MAAKGEGRRMGGVVTEGDEHDDPTGFGGSPGGLCSWLLQGVEHVHVCRRTHRRRAGLLCDPYDAVTVF